jgi:hypothetical protein
MIPLLIGHISRPQYDGVHERALLHQHFPHQLVSGHLRPEYVREAIPYPEGTATDHQVTHPYEFNAIVRGWEFAIPRQGDGIPSVKVMMIVSLSSTSSVQVVIALLPQPRGDFALESLLLLFLVVLLPRPI